MNSAKIISRVAACLKAELRQSNDTLKQHRSIIIDLEQCSKQFINLEDCQYYWSTPEQGEYMAAFGVCVSFNATGKLRFQSLQRQFQSLQKQWSNSSQCDLPIAFCSFAFDPNDSMRGVWNDFPNSELIIPKILVDIRASISRLIINIDSREDNIFDNYSILIKQIFSPSKQTQPKHTKKPQTIVEKPQLKQNWMRQVKHALQTLNQGTINKLVPSRHIRYEQRQAFAATHLLERMSQIYPSCHTLSIQQGNSRLVAASPERLLKIIDNQVSCNAIGGTLKRTKQQSIIKLFRHNSHSMDKLLHEHAIIVEHIYNVLDEFCETLKLPSAPGIMKLKHLLHLETPLRGKLKHPTSPILLAEKLHPTPAVAGFPISDALAWIKQNESHNRGLYTGAMGWLTPSGNGELSVILRCALLSQSSRPHTTHMDLYAGAGIVENSCPEEEWVETELKLDTILSILP